MNQIKTLGNAALEFGAATANQVKEKGKKGVAVANFIISNTDPLQKTSKVATAIFNLLAIVFGSLVPGAEGFAKTVTNFAKVTKTSETVIGATCVIGRIHEFTNERDRVTATWQKTAKYSTLGVGQALDTVAFVGSVAELNLGFLAATVVGNLPVLNLVKGAFIVASSGFSIWDSANILKDQAKAQSKLNAWKAVSSEDLKTKYTAT